MFFNIRHYNCIFVYIIVIRTIGKCNFYFQRKPKRIKHSKILSKNLEIK